MRIVVVFTLLFLLCGSAGSAAAPASLFVLQKTSEGFEITGSPIADGETRSFNVTKDGTVVDVILPISVGQSGNVVQRSQNSYSLRVTRDGGSLSTTILYEDGRTKEYPVISLDDLATWDVRVNAIDAGGEKAAFLIEGWESARRDSGPVIDMFGGVVPLQPGDVSVTTQVSQRTPSMAVLGEAPLTYSGGLLFVSATLAGGTTGEFIVDFGATGSAVAKWFLPAGNEIRELKGVEYSMEGDREVDGAMQAAGGDVSGFLGVATLGELQVGDAVFRDVAVGVVEEMPEFGGHFVAGILGANALRRADVVSFGYRWRDGKPAPLRFSAESSLRGQEGTVELPITEVQGHLFVPGSVNGVDVQWLLDTGARNTIVMTDAVHKAGRTVSVAQTETVRGLDGTPLDVSPVVVSEFSVGELDYYDHQTRMADLPVLRQMGLSDNGGLLGNDFLGNFREVEIDVRAGVIRLAP